MDQSYRMGELFGIGGDTPITGASQANPYTPQLDAEYVFTPSALGAFAAWWESGAKGGCKDGLMVTGPTGCGKTSFIEQAMARLRMPLVRVNAHEEMEVQDLLGHYVAIDGVTIFQDGPLLTAARNGWPILINEFDLLRPGTYAGLNGVFEGAPIVIAENAGEVVEPSPGFRYIVTGNTAGSGDITGIYAGTDRQNAATADRFWTLELDYPAKEVEVEILRKVENIPPRIAGPMVDLANQLRKCFTQGDELVLDLPMSTRALLRWAMITKCFSRTRIGAEEAVSTKPLKKGLEIAFSNRLEPAAKRAVESMVEAHFGVANKAQAA